MKTKSIPLLQAKIAELSSALFFCDNLYALSYAVHMIEVDGMDDLGFIWFSISKHRGHSVKPGEVFPVSLDFYRKGVPYAIYIKGLASIEKVSKDQLLLKIAIGDLQYKQFAETTGLPVLQTMVKLLKNVFDIPEPLDEYAVCT